MIRTLKLALGHDSANSRAIAYYTPPEALLHLHHGNAEPLPPMLLSPASSGRDTPTAPGPSKAGDHVRPHHLDDVVQRHPRGQQSDQRMPASTMF